MIHSNYICLKLFSLCFFFLVVPGIDGGGLADASLTDSYFSTSFIGVNGFGSPAESKYPMMQVIAESCMVFH